MGAKAIGGMTAWTKRSLHDESGQATVEAAFLLPVLLGLVLLLLQPGILLYDRMVMQHAAAAGCRVLAAQPSGDPDDVCRDYVLRRLGAVPPLDCFHVHGGECSWEVELAGGESSDTVQVSVSNKVKPLPLVGFSAVLLGMTDESGALTMEVSVSQSVQPDWVRTTDAGSDPSAWPGAWLS